MQNYLKIFVHFLLFSSCLCSCGQLRNITKNISENTKGIIEKDSLVENALFKLYNHITGEELEHSDEEFMTRKTAIACFQREIENDMLTYGFSRTHAVERFLYEAGYDKKMDGEIVVSPEVSHVDRITNVKQKIINERQIKEILKDGS